MQQLSIEDAIRQGEEAALACSARAERKSPGISDVMYAFLLKYAREVGAGERFTSEAITVAYAQNPAFEQPTDQRAWGGVFKRAVNADILAIADYDGIRTLGHGVKGAKRYRSLVTGKRPTEIYGGLA